MEPGKQLQIRPNIPLTVRLTDPQGDYFVFETNEGIYQTTAGEQIKLPRQAVTALFHSAAKPGEEIVITQHWDGLPGSSREWTIERPCLEAAAPATQPQHPGTTVQATQASETRISAPTPIRGPARTESPEQTRLFDRGTGTHGPAPVRRPAVARHQRTTGEQIPANVAIREILQFIVDDPGTRNWSAEARQDLASTVYIAHAKAGHIGLWEREQ